MCVNCVDCKTIIEEPYIAICDGFKENQKVVIDYGVPTEHYRWCTRKENKDEN